MEKEKETRRARYIRQDDPQKKLLTRSWASIVPNCIGRTRKIWSSEGNTKENE